MHYRVVFDPFAERHFIKTFARKYQGAWDRTRKVLELEFSLVDLLFEKSIAEFIHQSEDGDVRICKTEFKIAGTQAGRHASGNRCIIAIHKDAAFVRVLLVYSKSDVRGHRETDWWQQEIKGAYPDYAQYF